MEEGDLLKHYEYKDLHNVPESPGIYCWYARRKIAEIDWKGYSSNEFLEMISNDFLRYSSPSLDTKVNSYFGMEWSASNQLVTLDKWTDVLKTKTLCSSGSDDQGENDIDGEDFSPKNFFDIEKNRQFFSEVNRLITPVYESPLYIGKSKNLNHRLAAHKLSIDNCSSVSDGYNQELFETGKTFGERLSGAGFSSEELRVFTLDFRKVAESNELELNSDELNKMATIYEYILIRTVRPILGRL